MIIGITGTLGAGKGTVVTHLLERYGFSHGSARAFIIEELERRGLPSVRDNMSVVADDLRRIHHPGYIVEQLYERAKASGKDTVIESIHTTGEVENLKQKGDFLLLGVDADRKIRYERIKLRKSSTDQVSFEKFVEDEEKELHSTDPGVHNIAGCIQIADYVIMNDGTPEDLSKAVDTFMAFARETR